VWGYPVGGVNEIQGIDVFGNPTDGAFTLAIGGSATDPIPYSRDFWQTAMDIEYALRSLPDTGLVGELSVSPMHDGIDEMQKIVVESNPTGGTFKLELAARNEQQAVVLLDAVIGGTFTLALDAQTTADIAFDAPAADVQLALENLSNVPAGDVAVTGAPGGPWNVDFTGSLAMQDVASMTIDGTNLIGSTSAVITTQQGGVQRTGPIQFSRDPWRTADNIDVALRSLDGIEGDLWVQPMFDGWDEVQQIAISGNPDGGSFMLSYDAESTGAIAFGTSGDPWEAAGQTADNIEAALEGLSGLTEDLQVSGTFDDGTFYFDIGFHGENGLQNQPPLQVTQNNLTGAGPATIQVETLMDGAAPTFLELDVGFFARDGANDMPQIEFVAAENLLTGGLDPSMTGQTIIEGALPTFLRYEVYYWGYDGMRDQPQVTVNRASLIGGQSPDLQTHTVVDGERPAEMIFDVSFYGADGQQDQPQLQVGTNQIVGQDTVAVDIETLVDGTPVTEVVYDVRFYGDQDMSQLVPNAVAFDGGDSPQMTVETVADGAPSSNSVFDVSFGMSDGNQPQLALGENNLTGGVAPTVSAATVREGNSVSRNTELDGLTTVLHLVAPVEPNVANTIWLAIADTGDSPAIQRHQCCPHRPEPRQFVGG